MSSSTVINGFHVVLDDDGECLVSSNRAVHTSTLDFVKEDKVLIGIYYGGDLVVPDETIKQITEWAEMMGYTGD